MLILAQERGWGWDTKGRGTISRGRAVRSGNRGFLSYREVSPMKRSVNSSLPGVGRQLWGP